MKQLLAIASLSACLSLTACSTLSHDRVQYRTAEGPGVTVTDAIDGFESIREHEHPALYYYSPGMRRMNDASY